jgi:hypothetical protein
MKFIQIVFVQIIHEQWYKCLIAKICFLTLSNLIFIIIMQNDKPKILLAIL